MHWYCRTTGQGCGIPAAGPAGNTPWCSPEYLSKDFEEKILGDPERKQRIYEAICNHLILKYRSEDLEIVESDEVIQD